MSTHNICFRREVRKIKCGYPLLYVAMLSKYIVLCQWSKLCIDRLNIDIVLIKKTDCQACHSRC